MRKHSLATLAVLLAAVPTAGWTQTAPLTPAPRLTQAPVPTPVTVLSRFLEGMRTLKPCTIQYDTHGSLPGTRTPAYSGTIVWQDWQHMVIRVTEGPGVGEAYISGNQSWTYVPARNVYMAGLPNRLRGSIRQLPSTFEQIQHIAPKIMEDPWISFLLSTLRVTAETLDGEPVYRLAAVRSHDGKPADSPIASVSLVVGRTDYLPRRVTVTGAPEYARDITLRFTTAKAPFPPSTFIFTPPAGATKVTSIPEPVGSHAPTRPR